MRRVLLVFLLLMAFVFVGLVAHPKHTSATAACTPPCRGYFNGGVTNSYPGDATNILSRGINVNSAGSMAATLSNYLNFGSYQDQIGAAFIIDHMLGQGSFAGRGGAAAGVGYARANFGTWQNLVNYYASSPNPGAFGVQWNVFRSGVNPNSAFFFDINDDAFHRYIAGVDDGPVIRFYWPGGEFLIQRVCGNLEGSIGRVPTNSPPFGSISVRCDPVAGQYIATITLGDPDGFTRGHISTAGWSSADYGSGGPYTIPIPQSATSPYVSVGVSLYVIDSGPVGSGTYQFIPPGTATSPPCVALTCGSMTITPAVVDPFTKFSIKVSVTNNVNQPPPGATMSMRIVGPGFNQSYGPQAPDGGNPPTISSATFNNLGPTNSTGMFTVTWSLNSPFASVSCPGVGQPPQTFPVVNLPYLNIYGGDALTGASAMYNAGSSTCAVPNNNAGTFSWNNHSTDFSGAGAQYAVQALGQINDFSSAQDSSSPVPTGLAFANQYSPPNAGWLNSMQGLFGGHFGLASADCDFTSDITSPPTTVDKTIPVTSVATGTQDVIYVKDADVYISGNITYAGTGGWASTAQIPLFKLVVVGGSIYVDRNVRQLDGLYVAEPDNGLGGRGGAIYTCATGLRAPVSTNPPNYYSTCHNQLVINGAFVAKQVQFLRTFGSLGQARATDTVSSNHAGEVFNYTPELWLPRGGAHGSAGYSAITGLPPVL